MIPIHYWGNWRGRPYVIVAVAPAGRSAFLQLIKRQLIEGKSSEYAAGRINDQ